MDKQLNARYSLSWWESNILLRYDPTYIGGEVMGLETYMKSILILEDDENINNGITVWLQNEGYHVLSAFCISDAKELLKQHVDLIVSDIMLPDGNGMEFCKKIRETSNVYLIFLTALDQEIDIVSGYGSGADDYITKPFRMVALLSKINALMRRLGEKESLCMVSEDIILQAENMQVLKKGDIIALSKKEFQILKLLMENAGQIVTKERILEAVWDMDGIFVDENTIAVNISRLKSKLGTEFLTNVRGVGYIWTEMVVRK